MDNFTFSAIYLIHLQKGFGAPLIEPPIQAKTFYITTI